MKRVEAVFAALFTAAPPRESGESGRKAVTRAALLMTELP